MTVADAEALATQILVSLGTPHAPAVEVARSLVLANVVGHESHGLVRLREYASFVERGRVIPDAAPRVISDRGAAVMIDGQHGWGQTAAHFAVGVAADRARELGAAVVTIRNCNHVGRIGEYVDELTRSGLVGIMWCNADPCVAPFGGAERMLGTNPFAVGVPTESEPVVVDFATASVAEGKLRVARASGTQAPPGAVVDRNGAATTDPNDFYNGGALLPFGAHKGYGLSLIVELIGGALSGGHPSVNADYIAGNGVVLIAIDPAFFVGADAFLADTTEATQKIAASRPAREGDRVLLPGDVERMQAQKNTATITMADAIWADVVALRDEKKATA
ncbi:Ldh family oxidoreductase [Salinibacterium sp. ZJ77]|uniref:Ldh family oxidoreductase n=1 Tax=Salinibacterium sp. ZJ77 TaxID=2708337 RepID=UPI001423A3E8|nr:Ldh family oxidoreductase [Salinibacterium sp. ZJ77]